MSKKSDEALVASLMAADRHFRMRGKKGGKKPVVYLAPDVADVVYRGARQVGPTVEVLGATGDAARVILALHEVLTGMKSKSVVRLIKKSTGK